MNMIELKAPCKINLSLDITSKRCDGYHTLESIFQTVSLFDEITVQKKVSGIELCCDGVEIDAEKNTCYKAALLFFEKTKICGGVKITVKKNIPSQAGLGGGSSDAAAVLKGLNKLYDTELSDDELCRLGVKIGADVPFFIVGNTAYVSGIGEIIKPIKPIRDIFIAIAKGKSGISTVGAYKKFDTLLNQKHTNTKQIVSLIANSDIKAAAKLCVNSLEDCAELEDIEKIKLIFDKNGAFLSLMSGSGSAVFGLFTSKENAEAAVFDCSKQFAFAAVCTPFTDGSSV